MKVSHDAKINLKLKVLIFSKWIFFGRTTGNWILVFPLKSAHDGKFRVKLDKSTLFQRWWTNLEMLCVCVFFCVWNTETETGENHIERERERESSKQEALIEKRNLNQIVVLCVFILKMTSSSIKKQMNKKVTFLVKL